MLTGEFAINPKTIELIFSGGRGYHVHVKDIAFRGWGSAEAQEVVDYVCGIGINSAAMLSGKKPASPGWPMRYRETLVEYLHWIGTLTDREALAYLTGIEGIGKDSATTFLKNPGRRLSL